MPVQALAKPAPRDFQVVPTLQIHPDLGIHAEGDGEEYWRNLERWCYHSDTIQLDQRWASMAGLTTTLKLPSELRSRVAAVAKKCGRTPHSIMVEAIERHTTREERMREFVKQALAADRAIDAGGEVYAAADVHAWMGRLAAGKKPARPKPWRK